MPAPIPDHLRRKIADRLTFYQDLGITPFYRRAVSVFQQEPPAESVETTIATQIAHEESTLPKTPRKPDLEKLSASMPPRIASLPLPSRPAPSLFDASDKIADDTLLRIREDLGECMRCKLQKHRHTIVFGDGNPKAELVFVGEGPGADEDAQGLPFVGRAGKLLTQMIEAMGLQRKSVYICNVVKCRPPENRTPEDDEVSTCSPYLLRQLDVISPKVIVCLGAVAAKTLLKTNRGLSQFRGQWLDFRSSKLMATYHPAYLLRNPNAKGEVWKDLQKVMAILGLEAPKKTRLS
jgi:DNA polymerase